MSFKTTIALRYLKSKKSHGFLSFLSLISFLGIVVSVFSFVLIHSVMTGFSKHLTKALIGFNDHVSLKPPANPNEMASVMAWLKSQKEVSHFNPIIEFDGILSVSEGMAAGIKIRGVSPEQPFQDKNMDIYFLGDSTLKGLHGTYENIPGILIGEELYHRLKIYSVGEGIVTLMNPFGDIGPSGEMEPRQRNYKILGLFSSGFYDYDMRYVFVAEDEAGRLYGKRKWIDHISIRLTKASLTQSFMDKLQTAFPNVSHSTWQEQNHRLFSALKLEKVGMFLLLFLVTFIASFNVLGLMILLALGKLRDAAVLHALGLTRADLLSIFLRMGFFMGLAGSTIGFFIGGLSLIYLHYYPLPLSQAYYLDILPVAPDYGMIALFIMLTLLISILASFMATLVSRGMRPVELLRNT